MYIVERVLFKGFNGVYRRTCTVQMVFNGVYIVERVLFIKGLMVYFLECVLFKGFNGVYRRTCTVQRV